MDDVYTAKNKHARILFLCIMQLIIPFNFEVITKLRLSLLSRLLFSL